MPQIEGRKRLQPKMTRGGWRFQVWGSGVQAVAFSVLAFLAFRGAGAGGWDAMAFWLCIVCILLNATHFLYLLRVRRNDARFWDEEEASRADWERRGRRL